MIPEHASKDSAWRSLYAIGAACAALMVLLLPLAAAGFAVAPSPSDAKTVFATFERSALLGLVSLDLVYMLEIVLAGIVLLAIAVALRRVNPALVVLATFLDVTATALYFASNPAFEMLALSQRYASAAADVDRTIFVAAGEAVLAGHTGTAYSVSYVLAGAAGLTLAIAMRRGEVFGKNVAYLGIVMGVLALVPPTAGPVGYYAAFVYVLPFVVWAPLVARRLFQLARSPRATTPRRSYPHAVHVAAWLLLPFAASMNGVVRELTYGTMMTETAAHSLSTAPLLAIVALWAAYLARRWPLPDRRTAAFVATSWLLLTVVFETTLGVATGVPLSRIVAAYDPTSGSLWPLVPLATLFAPLLAHHLTRSRIPKDGGGAPLDEVAFVTTNR